MKYSGKINMKRTMQIGLFLLLAGVTFKLTNCAASNARAKYARQMLKAYRSMHTGDWAFYRLTDTTRIMMQVYGVSKEYALINRRAYFGGMAAYEGFTLEYNFDDIERNLMSGKDINGVIEISTPEISRDTVEVGDETLDCIVYTVRTATNDQIAVYVGDKIPLDGVVMVKRNGAVIRRLLTYGWAGQSPVVAEPPRQRP